jgi:hypothetical protein
MKEILASKFESTVTPFLSDGIIPAVSQKRVKKAIHTAAVHVSVAAQGINPVFGAVPLPIHSSEQTLPRSHRTTLSQLYSGKCFQLQSYQHFINSTNNNSCPDCKSAPTPHPIYSHVLGTRHYSQ